MLMLLQCIDDLIRKSGKKPADSHAAPWVIIEITNTSEMFNNVTIFLSPIPGAGQRDQAVHALQDRGVHLHQQVLLEGYE